MQVQNNYDPPLPADLADWLWRKWKVWCEVIRGDKNFHSYITLDTGKERRNIFADRGFDDPHTALLSALEAGLRWVKNKEQ